MVDADPDIRPCPDTTGHRAGVGEMKEPKCCGNCAKFEPSRPITSSSSIWLGKCLHVVALPACIAHLRHAVFSNSGQLCPCHEMKGVAVDLGRLAK
jgi:hypothetical protein